MTSTRRNTAITFLEAFKTLSVQDFISIRTPTCRHISAPASASPPPSLDNAAFAIHIFHLQEIMTSIPSNSKRDLGGPRAEPSHHLGRNFTRIQRTLGLLMRNGHTGENTSLF